MDEVTSRHLSSDDTAQSASAGDFSDGPTWSDADAAVLAEDIHHGRAAVCPACGGWVQGIIVFGAPTIRKPVQLVCDDCNRQATTFALSDNEGRRVPIEDGRRL